MTRERLGGWLGVAVAALLSACAETQLVSHTVKVIDTPKSQTEPPKAPATVPYKVGKPYQVEGVWYYPAEDYSYNETGIASWYGAEFHGRYTANGEVYDMNDLTAAHKTLPMPSLVRVTNLDNGRSMAVRINDRGPFKPGRIIDLSRRSAQLLGIDKVGTAKVRVEIMAEESRQLAALARRKPGAEDETVAAAPTGPIKAETLQPPPGAQAAQANPPPSSARPQPAPAPQAAEAPAPAPTGEIQVVPIRPTSIFVQAGSFTSFTNADRLSKSLASVAPARVEQATVGKQVFWRVRVGPAKSVEEADQIMARVAAAGYPEARLFVE